MRYAHTAVRGPDSISASINEALSKHAIAFDADPQRWESLRLQSLAGAKGQKYEDQLTVAKGLDAVDSLNNGMFKDIGIQMELAKDANGYPTIVKKDLWTEEERQQKKKEWGEAVVNGIGENLLKSVSAEAKQLINFLLEVNEATSGGEPKAPGELGHIWLVMFNYSNENPKEAISQEFTVLNERWQKITPDTIDDNNITKHGGAEREFESQKESPLIWSKNFGAFELHLFRRTTNPLFKKERRIVTQKDIDNAIAHDNLESMLLERHFRELLERIRHNIGDKTTWGELNKVREQIDSLMESAAGIGGSASRIKAKLQELRQSLILTARQSFSENIEHLRLIDEAEAYFESNAAKFLNPFIAQMLRKDGPIPNDEIVPCLLMEEPATIETVINFMDTNLHSTIRQEALSLLDEAIKEGASIDNRVAILAALGITKQ